MSASHPGHDASTLISKGVLRPCGSIGNQVLEVDGQAPTGRAGNQLRLVHPAPRGLEYVERRLNLWNGIAQKADADGVADAVEQDGRQPAGGLGYRVGRLAGFGDADVRGIIRLLGISGKLRPPS